MINIANHHIIRPKIVWVLLLITLAACWWWLLTFYGQGLRLAVLDFLDWVDRLGPWGPILFILVVTLSMLVLLPGMIFTLGGGFLFGMVNGLLYVLAGTALGASIAFFSGRYLCKNWVNDLLIKHPRTRRFVDLIEAEGMRFIMLTRMVPFFPFKLSNYAFGATNIPYRQFIIGTCVGIIPISLTNVYAGSLAGNLATLGTETVSESPLVWLLYGGGFIVAMIFALYISRLARRSLQPYVVERENED